MAKILIVDDEPMIAMLVEAWLVDLGHEPLGPAHSVAEARALLDGEFDGAIVDVTLGPESGRAVAEALTAKGAPFVYATGSFAEDLADMPPGRAILTKPFGLAEFEAAIGALFSKA